MTDKRIDVALCYAHALGEGGYPRDLRWLATALHNLGVKVALCTNERGEQTREGLDRDVPLWNITSLGERKETIHCAHFFGIFVTEQMKSMTILQKRGVPVIVSPFSQLLPLARVKSAWRKKLFLKRYFGLFHRVTAWSVFSETEWSSVKDCFGNVTGDRVFCGLGHYPSDEGLLIRAEPDPDERFRILFFGRCDVWQKGIDILLESYSVLGSICKMHGIRQPILTIAGRPHGDSETVIDSLTADLQEGDVVRLQNVAEADIATIYSEADLFVYPSRFDGPPRPIRRALELGVPVLASLEANMSEELALLGGGTSTSLRPDEIAARIFESMQAKPNVPRRANHSMPADGDWDWKSVAEKFAQIYHQFTEEKQLPKNNTTIA